MKSTSLRTIFFIWLAWALILIGYQVYVQARFEPQRPDYALSWTPQETYASYKNEWPYLREPFMNDHVAYDSEYYISIALGGYNDPDMRAMSPDFNWSDYQIKLQKEEPSWVNMNYAFMPFYPFVMRLLVYPLLVLKLTLTATATLAGVLASLFGTLGAMVALYDLARDDLGEVGGRRAAFYVLILPASMFLAQVYSEGVFLGLTFGAIALARRQKWLFAAILAMCATWTRAAGGLLLIPLVWYYWKSGSLQRLFQGFSWREIGKALLVISPVIAYLIWNAIYGTPFHLVETKFYGRGLLKVAQSAGAWSMAFIGMLDGKLPTRAYYLVEFGAIFLGYLTSFWIWKRDKALALYSLAIITFSLTSGAAQGMHRYVMAAPALFLIPAQWGEKEAFDRMWVLMNVLLMGVFAAMFSFDFWAG